MKVAVRSQGALVCRRCVTRIREICLITTMSRKTIIRSGGTCSNPTPNHKNRYFRTISLYIVWEVFYFYQIFNEQQYLNAPPQSYRAWLACAFSHKNEGWLPYLTQGANYGLDIVMYSSNKKKSGFILVIDIQHSNCYFLEVISSHPFEIWKLKKQTNWKPVIDKR